MRSTFNTETDPRSCFGGRNTIPRGHLTVATINTSIYNSSERPMVRVGQRLWCNSNTVYHWYHAGRQYNIRWVFLSESKRALYSRTEWYLVPFSEFDVFSHKCSAEIFPSTCLQVLSRIVSHCEACHGYFSV